MWRVATAIRRLGRSCLAAQSISAGANRLSAIHFLRSRQPRSLGCACRGGPHHAGGMSFGRRPDQRRGLSTPAARVRKLGWSARALEPPNGSISGKLSLRSGVLLQAISSVPLVWSGVQVLVSVIGTTSLFVLLYRVLPVIFLIGSAAVAQASVRR